MSLCSHPRRPRGKIVGARENGKGREKIAPPRPF